MDHKKGSYSLKYDYSKHSCYEFQAYGKVSFIPPIL